MVIMERVNFYAGMFISSFLQSLCLNKIKEKRTDGVSLADAGIIGDVKASVFIIVIVNDI